MCLSACLTFVVFTDCESYTGPISTNPGSMEAGECGLSRGTSFAERRLELVAVAGLLWIWWCVLGGAGFFILFVFFERPRPAERMKPPLASFTSLLVILEAKMPLHNEARPRERSDRGHYLPLGIKVSSYRGAYRVPLFN